ncbi:MAG: hypothetical protein AUF79_06865 [Crenarchaeota archaeon 13_1_20CM_2_51_8]|nr:MAG: hypothetical protein AUF79_06865 [Crenarchaeota archaeon 13_1_20CM_2_51_8]
MFDGWTLGLCRPQYPVQTAALRLQMLGSVLLAGEQLDRSNLALVPNVEQEKCRVTTIVQVVDFPSRQPPEPAKPFVKRLLA